MSNDRMIEWSNEIIVVPIVCNYVLSTTKLHHGITYNTQLRNFSSISLTPTPRPTAPTSTLHAAQRQHHALIHHARLLPLPLFTQPSDNTIHAYTSTDCSHFHSSHSPPTTQHAHIHHTWLLPLSLFTQPTMHADGRHAWLLPLPLFTQPSDNTMHTYTSTDCSHLHSSHSPPITPCTQTPPDCSHFHSSHSLTCTQTPRLTASTSTLHTAHQQNHARRQCLITESFQNNELRNCKFQSWWSKLSMNVLNLLSSLLCSKMNEVNEVNEASNFSNDRNCNFFCMPWLLFAICDLQLMIDTTTVIEWILSTCSEKKCNFQIPSMQHFSKELQLQATLFAVNFNRFRSNSQSVTVIFCSFLS
jgi:hypothetical protein